MAVTQCLKPSLSTAVWHGQVLKLNLILSIEFGTAVAQRLKQELVPSAIHKIFLWSCEEVMKQISPGTTTHNIVFGDFCRYEVKTSKKLGFNPCPSLPSVATNDRKQSMFKNNFR